MSLDYDLRKIKDRSTHFPAETDPAITQIYGTLNRKVFTAIWSCISVQIGEITEANADEWFERYAFFERLTFTTNPEDLLLTREDVHHLVGLKTNVFPDLPLSQWLLRQFKFHQQGLARQP